MKQKRKRWGFGVVTALALTVFTGYALLDTFVIPRSYGTVPQIVDTAAEEVQALTQEAATQETSVQEEIEHEETSQEGITVELNEYRENDTTIYVADVWVQDPSQLKTAFANGTFGKNVKDTTSDIADSVDALGHRERCGRHPGRQRRFLRRQKQRLRHPERRAVPEHILRCGGSGDL